MERKQFSKLRRLAVVAVLSNLAVITVLAWSLSGDAQLLLPLIALMLPLLTAAALEGRISTAREESQRSVRPAQLATIPANHGYERAA